MKNMQTQSILIRILKLFRRRKKTVAFLILLIVFWSALDIAVPFISQKLIDGILAYLKNGSGSPLNTLFLAAMGILIATILSQVARSTYNYHLFTTVTQVEDEVRNRAFRKYLDLHSLFHHGSTSGQIIGRLDRGASAIWAIVYELLGFNLLPPFITFSAVFLALLFKSPGIALAVVAPFPIYILAIQRLSNRISEVERQASEEYEIVSKEAYDAASNVLTVKKFSQEEKESQKYGRLLANFRKTQYRAEKLWAYIENVQGIISTVGRIGVIVFAGFLVINGKNTIGEFVLFISLQNMAYSPLWQLSSVLPRLRRNISRVERLFQLLDEPIRVLDKPGAIELPPHQKEIEFRNVWFRYAPDQKWALRNVSVKIPAKSTVALVGRSGSGKTTFINLLLRSFDVEEGAILIDGLDIRDVTQESLHRQIAVVPQEVDLFSRSIAENIAYGNENAGRQEIIAAAKSALAHDFIMKTEKGYDTVVGERGIKLSGGERQRIGIARAIFKNPRILILDEATSHLDTESERLIQRATENLMRDRTTIIIAHRLSTVMRADKILVFAKGEVEAEGTHQELLLKSPTYRKLYEMQFARQ
jgi:ABC-type multidrug transport system fused ATPase/permease subunit